MVMKPNMLLQESDKHNFTILRNLNMPLGKALIFPHVHIT